MGNQKYAYRRYTIIDRCLNNSVKKFWTKLELLDALASYDIEISASSLEKDIEAMRWEKGLSFEEAPIEYKKRKGYYYTRPFNIGLPFDDDDLRLLTKAALTLEQFKDISYFQQFAGAVDKVVRLIKLSKESTLGLAQPYILFEKVPYLKGFENLDPIIKAIEERRCIEIHYQKFGQQAPDKFTICPYFVKEFHNRWYVVAYNLNKSEIRTYALDRLTQWSTSYESFIDNTFIDPETYFRDCIGVTLDSDKIETVTLAFNQSQGEYIKTQHIHRSQEFLDKKDDDKLWVQLKIIINHELIMTLLSYGANVKVVEPLSLAKQIAEIGAQMVKLYE